MINLGPDERIYLFKRIHPILLKLWLLPYLLILLFIFLSVLFFFFYKISWPVFVLEKFSEVSKFKLNFIFAFFLSLTLPFFWSLIFLEITKYYLTYWVVTNERIIEARMIGFFNIQYSSVELEKIQDMRVLVKGFLPSFFHFGDLIIQTAAEKGEFILEKIDNPELAKQVIFEAKIDYEKNKKL